MKILHYISKTNTFLLLFFLMYFVFKFLFGSILNIFFEKNIIFEFIYICLSIIVIKKYVKISSPYEKFMKKY